jgi:cytochrome c oxidase subunit II
LRLFPPHPEGVDRAAALYGTSRLVMPIVAVVLPTAAEADAPMTFLRSFGAHADPIKNLTWGVMLISLAVIVITTVLLLAGLGRRRNTPMPELPGSAAVAHPPGGLPWLYIGVGVSTVVLFAVMVWTVVVLAAVSPGPVAQAALQIEVKGHQWWWEVTYASGPPDRQFTTASEIHIPVGETVGVKLEGVDVIHSFWVPTLAGKTDVIPGQINLTWLQAHRPGVYRGQCTEYCGKQHAHMAFEVVASPANDFKAWWGHQLEGAGAPESPAATADENAFVLKCGICHTVRGTRANGRLGPDLSHLMARRTIAAGTLPNTPGHLSAWISDPQHVKPGNLMPRLDVSGPDLARIRRFLESQK